jgi:hypothetical protein
MSCMKTLVTIFALIILGFTSLAMGQSDEDTFPAITELSYNYFGGGARAHAMGSANIGLANDVNGGSWNPAGLWTVEEPMVSASYKMFNSNGSFGFDRKMGSTVYAPPSNDNTINLKSIGHFAFVAPVRVKGHPFTFNFNYVRDNEHTLKVDLPFSNANLRRNDKAYLRTYNFGFSTRVYKQLSFGLLANVYDGGRINEYIRESFSEIIVDVASGTSLDAIVSETVLDSVKASGFNLSLGLMYKMDKVSIGATVKTPFEMKNNRDESIFNITTIGGLPNIDNSDTIYVQDILTKQDMPLSLGFGIGFTPSEKLTFVLDGNYQKYGSVKWYYLVSTKFTAGGDRIDEYQSINIDWNNVFGVGGGVEYKFTTGIGVIPLRAGVRYNQLPQSEAIRYDRNTLVDDDDMLTGEVEYNYTGEGRQNEMWFTLGTGIHWGKLEFDFAYRIATGSEYEVVNSYNLVYESSGEPYPGADSLVETEKIDVKSNQFIVSFVGRF